ncbi:8205_t:CDS:2, partial [Ambispora leptoticha]
AFIEKFLKDEIPPSVKSEPIPEKNDGPVYVLVADIFEEIVYDKDKDVLKLTPIYEKLGEAYQKFKDKIVIAKMDATENDLPTRVPFTVSGFPTIKLFKAGEDKEIVDYQGDRSFESFVEFLDANAVNKVDVDVTPPSDSPAASESESETTATAAATTTPEPSSTESTVTEKQQETEKAHEEL